MNMLKIGIYDMDSAVVQNLLGMLKEVLYQYADWEVQVFDDADRLIRAIDEEEFDCNLLFMDIFQKGDTGVQIVQYVEQRHVDTDIIFITASEEHVFECYRNHTFAYLLKPLKAIDINKEVQRYLKEIQVNPKCLNISNRGNITRIPLDTILYIESKYRKIIVHTMTEKYEYYEKLDVLEDVLKSDGFVRCHQSYLVSINRISMYKDAVLKVGEYAVPISRKYKKAVRESLSMHEAACMDSSRMHSDGKEQKNRAKRYENCYLTSGLFQNNDTKGALVCVQGAYIGNIVRIVPEQSIIIGRDGTSADMVVNLPLVSRQHCTIIYHEKEDNYEVVDYSTNGTFVDGSFRMKCGDIYLLKPGATLSFGDKNTIYRLG